MKAKIIGTCRSTQNSEPLHRYGHLVVDRAGKVSTELLFQTVTEAYQHLKHIAKDYHYQYGERPPKELKQAYKDSLTMMGNKVVGVKTGDCQWELVTSYAQKPPFRKRNRAKLSPVSFLLLRFLEARDLNLRDFSKATKMEQELIIEAYNRGEAENWITDPNKAEQHYKSNIKTYKP